jgi:hypothetical protein
VTAHAHALAPRQAARRTGAVAVVSALAGALAVLAVLTVVGLMSGSGSGSGAAAPGVYTAAGHAFTIGVPAGWSALHGAELARVPGSPAAVLRRADGRGVVIVRRTGAVTGDLRWIARRLTAQLGRRLPGFRLVGARIGRVRAGDAFLYTFVRRGVAQSLAVTTVRGATYRIDTVVPAGSPDAARQAGAAVSSFGP